MKKSGSVTVFFRIAVGTSGIGTVCVSGSSAGKLSEDRGTFVYRSGCGCGQGILSAGIMEGLSLAVLAANRDRCGKICRFISTAKRYQ